MSTNFFVKIFNVNAFCLFVCLLAWIILCTMLLCVLDDKFCEKNSVFVYVELARRKRTPSRQTVAMKTIITTKMITKCCYYFKSFRIYSGAIAIFTSAYNVRDAKKRLKWMGYVYFVILNMGVVGVCVSLVDCLPRVNFFEYVWVINFPL